MENHVHGSQRQSHLRYLLQGISINVEYYANLLQSLSVAPIPIFIISSTHLEQCLERKTFASNVICMQGIAAIENRWKKFTSHRNGLNFVKIEMLINLIPFHFGTYSCFVSVNRLIKT